MDELIIHQQTRRQVDDYIKAPAHAVVLVGPAGSGKLSLAKNMAETSMGLDANNFDSYGYSYILSPEDGKSIGIEAARQLEHFLSLKVPSARPVNRAVIIEDSHLLTTEAQNALLKTIEEPPQGTILIMTAHHERSLLPTIHSRLQTITLRRPARADIQAYFAKKGFDEARISQVFAMSAGLLGLMQTLLSEDDHPLRTAAQQARQLLSQSTFERLITVDALARQKDLATSTVTIMQQMAHLSLQSASGPAAERWQKILRASYDAADALSTSAQLKLALVNMVLQF